MRDRMRSWRPRHDSRGEGAPRQPRPFYRTCRDTRNILLAQRISRWGLHEERSMKLSNKKILILATHGFEQAELEVPRDRLKEAGATVHVVSPEKGEIRGWNLKDWG